MKLPKPIEKKPILVADYGSRDEAGRIAETEDPFAQTNPLSSQPAYRDFHSVQSNKLENISVMSGDQAALMAKE